MGRRCGSAHGLHLFAPIRPLLTSWAQADQFSSVHKKLDDVKNVMVQNIEMVSARAAAPCEMPASSPSPARVTQVLERGEKLELLVDKSEQLQLDSFRFQKSSKKLRQAMFWKKARAGAHCATVSLRGFRCS